MFLLALPASDKVYTALAGVAVAVFVLVLDMVKTAFSQWREDRKKARQNSFVYLAEKQVLLDQATERICLHTKADHVSLYRLHNGQFFEGDDSIKKMTMVSESVRHPSVARRKAVSQALLLSNYPFMVLGMSKEAFYVMYADSAQDFEVRRGMGERGYATAVGLLILGKKDRPLAVLLLSWCERRVTLADLNLSALDDDRRALSFTLAE